MLMKGICMFRGMIRRGLVAGCALAVAMGATRAASAEDADSKGLVTTPFEETFARVAPSRWYISDGWSNGDHQNCTWSRRAIGLAPEGGATLKFLPLANGSMPNLCGEIQTQGWFSYGTFEARVRSGAGAGFNAAFFTYTGPVHDQPHDEIDFEILTKQPDYVWTNRYVSGDEGNEGGRGIDIATPAQDGFHDYAIIWEPDRLRWFVDGKLVREATDHIPTHRMKVYFSLWATETLDRWMGRYETPDGPVEMVVKRFRYTPLGTGCSFDGSILCDLK